MGPSDVKLAALIGSRICHDLISPIGAINNGLELLGMTGAGTSPEMELISESVENANARIRFFRIAFGAAGVQDIGPSEVKSVLDDMLRSSRLTVDYLPLSPQPRNMVRLSFLALLCLEAALPYGGVITILCDESGWHLRGASDKMNVDDALWSVLAEPSAMDNIEPPQVQFALLPTLAREDGRVLRVDMADTHMDIRF